MGRVTVAKRGGSRPAARPHKSEDTALCSSLGRCATGEGPSSAALLAQPLRTDA